MRRRSHVASQIRSNRRLQPIEVFIAYARNLPSPFKDHAWLVEAAGRFQPANEMMAPEGVVERVLDVALSTQPYTSPGPRSTELEELLV